MYFDVFFLWTYFCEASHFGSIFVRMHPSATRGRRHVPFGFFFMTKNNPDIQKQAVPSPKLTQAIQICPRAPRGFSSPQMISPRSVDLLILGSLQGEGWGWNRERWEMVAIYLPFEGFIDVYFWYVQSILTQNIQIGSNPPSYQVDSGRF